MAWKAGRVSPFLLGGPEMGNYRSILEAVDYSAMAVMAWLVGWV